MSNCSFLENDIRDWTELLEGKFCYENKIMINRDTVHPHYRRFTEDIRKINHLARKFNILST